MNGLKLDIHAEEQAIEMFARNILLAGQNFLENPMEKPFMPSWNRVTSAMPNVLKEIHQAVEDDMNEYL